MQHEAAPMTGALNHARFLASIPPLARSIGLGFLLISAPSMALAQSAVSVVASDGTASESHEASAIPANPASIAQ